MPDHNFDTNLREVEVDQGALMNILSRYPGTFDVLRELIQNADDAEAPIVEIHLQSDRTSKPAGELDNVSALNVRKWVIKNKGSFREKDWERLGRIAAGNDDSTKVGAFGVGFYSVLSKSDRPLVRSNGEYTLYHDQRHIWIQSWKRPGKVLEFRRGHDGKLFKCFANCLTDDWTSVELELRVPEPLPVLSDLARFLVSSVAFLTNIYTISIHLDEGRLLHIHKESCESPVNIPIPSHMMQTTLLRTLTVESVQHTVQRIMIDAAESVFSSASTSLLPPADTADTLTERSGRFVDYSALGSSSGVILQENAITHDLYTAVIRVDLLQNLKMKRGVESSMKSLPSSFKCKAIYFNSKQCDALTCIKNSELPKAKYLASLCSDSQGIVPGNSGRLFIGQSTNQTTGIGLHISAHFLPTMERGSIDLANGEVAAWNREVLWVSGFLARIIYEKEMHIAAGSKGSATQLGLRTMGRFAFNSTLPHNGVSEILQDAFFSCCHKQKPPLPVVFDTGVSCASDPQLRQSNKDLSFLKSYRILHKDVEARQCSEIIKRYEVPHFTYKDIVREFETGVSQETMRSFLLWWEDTKRNLSSPKSEAAGKEFCKQFASRGILRENNGVEIALKNIKYFTFFTLPDDLSPLDSIYIDVTSGVPTRNAIECFGWTHLPLLVWLTYACSQARRLALNGEPGVGRRVLRSLVQFALVEAEEIEWDQVADLMKDIKCIPTNMGLALPADSYFDEADICRNVPVAKESDFLDIPAIYIADARGFRYAAISPEHVRRVLVSLRVRHTMEWKDVVEGLEAGASEESNDRLLQFLVTSRNRLLDTHINDLKEKKVFYSVNHGRVSATDLHLPNEDIDIHKLGLPTLALPLNSLTSQISSAVDTSGSFAIGPFLESLGIRRYPSLHRTIELAASNQPEVQRYALQYLLSNLETRYAAYEPSDFINMPFIPTECGSLARPDEVFASPEWVKLGFKQASKSLRRDFSRLGIKDDPSVDTIIKHLRAPERTLPDLDVAATWFGHLFLYGKLPVLTLREQFSTVPFVPAKSPGCATSRIEYFPPKDCFTSSTDIKEHYRDIFPFVDFGPNGNSFLESCCAKKSPDAADFARKMVQDPRKYLKALGNDTNLYLEDLRTISTRFDSIPEHDKKEMQRAPMFLAFRQGVNGGELLPAHQVVIRDWEARDFGTSVFLAPEDDVVQKMYHKMGSEFLGKYVQYDITHAGVDDNYNLPFNRDQVIRRINCFIRQRDQCERTDASFYNDGSMDSFRVMACKTLWMKKTFAPPWGVLTDGMEPKETVPVQVQAGFEFGEPSTLWVVKGSSNSVDLRNDVAVALCRVLLKTFGPNDVLLLASLFAMGDENLDSYYGREMKSVSAPPVKVEPKKLKVKFPVPSHLAKVVGLVGIHTRTLRLPGQKTISLEDDMQKAIASSRGLDSDTPDFSAPCQRQHTDSKKPSGQCKEAHRIKLKEKTNLRDETTQIKFFLAEKARCREPPQVALREFAKLISDLAHVFGLEATTTCYIFWKDTDEDLMAFNRDQRYIFFNLAHYYKFFHNRIAEQKRVVEERKMVTEWFLIMAHEIAHNVTLDHDEYHGSLSSKIAVTYLPDLHKYFRCFAEGV